MGSKVDQLHIIFLPFLTPGHMIPMVDMARLFAAHGVKVTIITTTFNALTFQKAIDRDNSSGHQIRIHTLQLPYEEVGLPKGVESFNAITSPDMYPKLFRAISMLQQPIEQLFHELQADCIISDSFYPWTADAANKIGIPRLVLHGSYFFLCAADSVKRYAPHQGLKSDTETFVLPGLPHRIQMIKSQLPDWVRTTNEFTLLMNTIAEADQKNYGIIVDSFYELEHDYEDHYKSTRGTKAWSVGPVSLWANKDAADKAERGNNNDATVEPHDCLNWLDSKKPRSVLYVTFGSLTKFPAAQLREIANCLEASGHDFMWAVKKHDKEEEEEWLPEGFGKRMKETNRGLLVRGWVPQLLIMEHPAVGGLVTHCGWNSILEGVIAGLPMITWPQFAEQFYNEKLLTDVLKIGVAVGVREWCILTDVGKELITRDKVEKAATMLMGNGDEAEERRKRAKELADAAKRAVQSGGSSETSLKALINELKSVKSVKRQAQEN